METRRRNGGKWQYIWPMWTTLLLHLIAILLFTTGFLLTRTELPYHSHCSDDVSHSPCFSPSSSHNNGSCWTKPSINRLVVIVLDAIRYPHFSPALYIMHVLFTIITIDSPCCDAVLFFVHFRFDFVAPSTFFPG